MFRLPAVNVPTRRPPPLPLALTPLLMHGASGVARGLSARVLPQVAPKVARLGTRSTLPTASCHSSWAAAYIRSLVVARPMLLPSACFGTTNIWAKLSFFLKVNTVKQTSHNRGRVSIHLKIAGVKSHSYKNEGKIIISLKNKDRNA